MGDENCKEFRDCFGSNRNNLGENGPKKGACIQGRSSKLHDFKLVYRSPQSS